MSRAPGGSHGILKAKDNEKDPQIMRSPVSKKFVFWPSGGGGPGFPGSSPGSATEVVLSP